MVCDLTGDKDGYQRYMDLLRTHADILPKEDVMELFKRLQASTDEKEKGEITNIIFNSHCRMVVKIAKEIASGQFCSNSLTLSEIDDLTLISEGNAILMDCIKGFNPFHDSKASFSFYAFLCIRRKLKGYVLGEGLVRIPRDFSRIKDLAIKEEKVQELKKYRVTSLDSSPSYYEADDLVNIIDLVPDLSTPSPSYVTENQDLKEYLLKHINHISSNRKANRTKARKSPEEEWKDVLVDYFFNEKSLSEISKKYKTTRQAISAKLHRGLRHLNRLIVEEWMEGEGKARVSQFKKRQKRYEAQLRDMFSKITRVRRNGHIPCYSSANWTECEAIRKKAQEEAEEFHTACRREIMKNLLPKREEEVKSPIKEAV